MLRAQYLVRSPFTLFISSSPDPSLQLRLQGEDVLGEGKTLLDPKELMEILEAREEVEAEEDVPALKALQERTGEEHAELVQKLSKAFAQRDVEGAKRHTIKLQYLTKLREELGEKLTALGE